MQIFGGTGRGMLIGVEEVGGKRQDLTPFLATSPAHRGWQVWNVIDVPGIKKHGDFKESIEGIKALTPELLSETLGRIRDVMNGTNCECVLK